MGFWGCQGASSKEQVKSELIGEAGLVLGLTTD